MDAARRLGMGIATATLVVWALLAALAAPGPGRGRWCRLAHPNGLHAIVAEGHSSLAQLNGTFTLTSWPTTPRHPTP